MHQIAQIYMYIFKKFSGGNTLDPKTGEGLSSLPRLPIDECPPSHFFRASAATGFNCAICVVQTIFGELE